MSAPENKPPSSSTKTELAGSADSARAEKPVIPDHELLRCIGAGSYGEVWLARNTLGTYRAIKVVYRSNFENDRPYEREFGGIQKFEPISRSHPSQLPILHVGRNKDAGYFYYVMELADDVNAEQAAKPLTPSLSPSDGERVSREAGAGEGETSALSTPHSEFRTPRSIDPFTYFPKTLSSVLKSRGRLPHGECLHIALALTTALEHLHGHGLIHRDIKPANIVFIGGVPKLADIGLVTDVASARTFVGTEGYFPPEGPGAPAADLYSLGKVLYEMATGRDRMDFPELPTNLGELRDREEVLELNEIILKACANDVAKRYQSATEMHADLLLLKVGKSVKHTRTLERQLRLLVRVAVVGGVVVALTLGALAYQKKQTQRALEISERETQLRLKAEQERQRADANAKMAEANSQQAEQERQKAQAEEKKAKQTRLTAMPCVSFAGGFPKETRGVIENEFKGF